MQNLPIDVAVSHNTAIDALFAKFSISIESFATDARTRKTAVQLSARLNALDALADALARQRGQHAYDHSDERRMIDAEIASCLALQQAAEPFLYQ